MRTKVNEKGYVSPRKFRYLIIVGLVFLGISILLSWFSRDEQGVERYYANGFYPLFSFIAKGLFSWIPFSVGDLVYVGLFVAIIYFFVSSLIALSNKFLKRTILRLLQLMLLLLATYVYFHISWGQNYYRVPLQKQFSLDVQSVTQDEYISVVERYIDSLNRIRASIDIRLQDRSLAETDIEQLMLASSEKFPMLSRTQVKVKHPISSHLISFFTVTGYFNPFTQEVHVNQMMPKTSYPFTVAHELAHQMGIGLEDECNFVAFLALRDHSNPWYRYAAYYETVQYLVRPLYYQDKSKYSSYLNLMSDEVRSDYNADKEFWKGYRSWINTVSAHLYGSYLRHNNQPEGIARYTLMGRLVVAWEYQREISPIN